MMKEGSLANDVNYGRAPLGNYDVSGTPSRLCRPHYSQGVVANSEHHLDQLLCLMEGKEHSQGFKGT